MRTQFLLLCIFSFLCLSTLNLNAQTQPRTITVTGNYTHNLSPNEIIIKLVYEEYFTDTAEKADSKVPLEGIEKKVIQSLKAAGIKDDKITMGAASLHRPRDKRSNTFKKRRLQKSLFLCISNTEEYVQLIRQLEKDNLFDKEVTYFDITEFKHTEKESYIEKSHTLAFADAKAKAELILSNTDQKVGKAMTVEEVLPSRSQIFSAETYGFDNSATETVSGFSPLVVKCKVKVVFEIL